MVAIPDTELTAGVARVARVTRSFAQRKLDAAEIDAYLHECRELVVEQIRRSVPADTRATAGLYDIMLDYPLRPAKALRPALCVAVCRALGGSLDGALPSAAALELFHNACLVHDDIEDSAFVRRHGPALHLIHGVSVAVNVGDAMLATALDPLLANVGVLGLGPALGILTTFSRMARESAEGQMLELGWARDRRWELTDKDYLRMVHKKTGWYSFIAPVEIGAIAAGADRATRGALGRFALYLGVAFQIQDDLLGLESNDSTLGKDALGDLWEGKYTLPLIHALRSAPPEVRAEALAILARPRPGGSGRTPRERADRVRLFQKLERTSGLERAERRELERALLGADGPVRSSEDVARLGAIVTGREGASLEHARSVARRFAARAVRVLERELSRLPESIHRAFLAGLVGYVVERTH